VTILVRGARQLLTLRGPAGPRRGPTLADLGVIPDGSLLIRDGTILEAGPTRRVENLAAARPARELNAAGRVVMPGFVDCHTHLACDAGLGTTVNAVRAAQSSRLEARARSTAARMLRHGTTAFESKSGYGLDHSTELKILRVTRRLADGPWEVVAAYFGARAVPPDWNGPAYLDWILKELLPKIHRRKLARFVEADAAAFGAADARTFLLAARALGFAVKVQGDATVAVETGAVAVSRFDDASPGALSALAASPSVAVLLPDALAHARTLADLGAAVALSSGFDPGRPTTDSMQAVAAQRRGLTPEEALAAATINAAHALGLGARIGSLEPGKQADLLLLNCSDYREIPYHFGVNHVHLTMKRGTVVYREGSAGAWPKPS